MVNREGLSQDAYRHQQDSDHHHYREEEAAAHRIAAKEDEPVEDWETDPE